jgi:hypothetical protein
LPKTLDQLRLNAISRSVQMNPLPDSVHHQKWEIKFKNCEIRVMKSKIFFYISNSYLQRGHEFMYSKSDSYQKKIIKYNFCIIFALALMD